MEDFELYYLFFSKKVSFFLKNTYDNFQSKLQKLHCKYDSLKFSYKKDRILKKW